MNVIFIPLRGYSCIQLIAGDNAVEHSHERKLDSL